MWSALLGSPVVNEDRGLTLLVNGGVDLGVSHQLDLDGRQVLGQAKRDAQDKEKQSCFHGNQCNPWGRPPGRLSCSAVHQHYDPWASSLADATRLRTPAAHVTRRPRGFAMLVI